jgi:hypothetical protein
MDTHNWSTMLGICYILCTIVGPPLGVLDMEPLNVFLGGLFTKFLGGFSLLWFSGTWYFIPWLSNYG